MLLVFGNVTDIFTDRTFDLCSFNFTLFDEYCPHDVHLTPENFPFEYKYVFILISSKFYFINIYIENAI